MLENILSIAAKWRAVGWVALWSVSFCFIMTLAKMLSPALSNAVVVFMRCTFGMLFFLPFVARKGVQELKTQRFPLHFLRLLFIFGSMICTYYAYRHLPLAFATSIGFSGPLITTVISIIVLKNRVRSHQWLALFVGYIGVLILLRPSQIEITSSVLIALTANFFAGCNLVITRKLSVTESPLTLMAYSNIVGFFISGAVASLFWTSPPIEDILLLVLIGCFGVITQYCYIRALRLTEPAFLAPFEYGRLLIAVPIGYFVFHEVPQVWTYIGSLIILASTYYLTVVERRFDQAESQKISSKNDKNLGRLENQIL